MGNLTAERALQGARVKRVAVVEEVVEAHAKVATLTPGEIERVLAWHHRLFDSTNAPLPEIVAAFNQRNAVQFLVLYPELAAIRLSAALRSDNLEGFVHLLERGFDVRAERRGDTEIVLRRSSP